ncbi:MAG: hypothetical protein L3K00_07165 [Thermoplasmata archaeon]|nr:hypothetical protein [Thermoplasmata archaeon]
MNSVDFLLGLSLGLALAAAVYGLLWWMGRPARGPGFVPPTHRSTSGAPPPTPVSDSPEPEPQMAPAGADPPAESPHAATGTASAPRSGPSGGRNPAADETLRLSQRLILHVYAQGIRPSGEVAPLALCQAGMVEALGIPQAGLAAVLRRLEAAGILLAERSHVQGRDRRLKVYRLSERGLVLARELRTRSSRRRAAR